MTKGKLTAIDIIKPIFITSLDRHCEKLVRMFPANKIVNYDSKIYKHFQLILSLLSINTIIVLYTYKKSRVVNYINIFYKILKA